MTSIPVTDATFDQEVNNSTVPVVVYFWAQWCGPCKQVGPALEQLYEEMKDHIKICKIDVDQNPNTANTLGVRGLPSMFIFSNGQVIASRSGSASKRELKSWIQDSI